MEDKVRCNLTLDADVIGMLDDLAGSERKRGLWISQMIRTAYEGKRTAGSIQSMDIDAMRLTLQGFAGRLYAVEGELLNTQTQLAALIARSAGQGSK